MGVVARSPVWGSLGAPVVWLRNPGRIRLPYSAGLNSSAAFFVKEQSRLLNLFISP
jgi:hypothetical protein